MGDDDPDAGLRSVSGAVPAGVRHIPEAALSAAARWLRQRRRATASGQVTAAAARYADHDADVCQGLRWRVSTTPCCVLPEK